MITKIWLKRTKDNINDGTSKRRGDFSDREFVALFHVLRHYVWKKILFCVQKIQVSGITTVWSCSFCRNWIADPRTVFCVSCNNTSLDRGSFISLDLDPKIGCTTSLGSLTSITTGCLADMVIRHTPPHNVVIGDSCGSRICRLGANAGAFWWKRIRKRKMRVPLGSGGTCWRRPLDLPLSGQIQKIDSDITNMNSISTRKPKDLLHTCQWGSHPSE